MPPFFMAACPPQGSKLYNQIQRLVEIYIAPSLGMLENQALAQRAIRAAIPIFMRYLSQSPENNLDHVAESPTFFTDVLEPVILRLDDAFQDQFRL